MPTSIMTWATLRRLQVFSWGAQSSSHCCPPSVRTPKTLLSAVLHAPVVDHTGLSGVFNIDLSHTPDGGAENENSNLPTFFTAVEEQLGLKLQVEKVSVKTVDVDHLSAEPAAN